MTDGSRATRDGVLRFNPSLHDHPWVALEALLDHRGPGFALVIDGAMDGPVGRITSQTAHAQSRLAVIDALSDASLLSLVVVRGPMVHGDEALALALACDVRWMSPGATFRPQALPSGVLPYASVSHLAVERLGAHRALALAAGDQAVTSSQALVWGLVDEVVPDHELEGRVEAWVSRIALLPRELLAEAKALLSGDDVSRSRRREDEARRRLAEPS